jgi:hypothetical protein
MLDEFISKMSKEMGCNPGQEVEFIKQLEQEMIYTLEDLQLLIFDDNSWGKLTAQWPLGFKSRV